MASIASDSTTHPVAAQALQGLEQGRRLLLNTFKYVPEDKLNWTPSATSRSALRIAAHCAVTNYGIAQMLRGESAGGAKTFTELFAIMEPHELAITSKEQATHAIEDSSNQMAAALQAVSPEQIEQTIGEGELAGPASFYMNLPGIHMSMHSAQVDYLQTTWGDCVPHFGG